VAEQKLDKELEFYRSLVEQPTEFHEGFGWKTIVGAVFVGFLMMPGSMYMMLVAGLSIGPAARWVTVILFMEIARRSLQTLKKQEVYILFYMAGFALASPFQGLLWRQFLVQSDAAKEFGVAGPLAEYVWWYAPPAEKIQEIGYTFMDKAWVSVIGLMLLYQVISRIDHFGLGYALFRVTSDFERLPFPMAPIAAQGATALSETTEDKQSWRWRTFSIGSMVGLFFGTIYFGLPAVTGAVLGKPMQIIPLPWIELTDKTGDFLPAVATGITFDVGLLLLGMVLPFWAVMGGAVGFAITLFANPVLYKYKILHSWHPGMQTVDTLFANNFDFYMSFGIGLASAIALVGFFKVFGTLFRKGSKETGSIFKPPEGRGDFNFWISIGIYIFATLSYMAITLWLLAPEMKDNQFSVWVLMGVLVFYGFVYTPFMSYATARLEGMAGQTIGIPFVREATFILSGYRGIAIWFAPIPIRDYGRATRRFREIELTGTRLPSIIKTELVTFPIVIIASIIFSEFIFRLGPVPSESYPYAQKVWDLNAKNMCLVYTSTMGSDSPFYEALNGWYILTGLSMGGFSYIILALFGLPTMLIYGVVRGLGQTMPHGYVFEFIGAMVGRYYFQKKFGRRRWLQLAPVILAGFSCGMGLVGMGSVAIAMISKSVSQLAY